MTQQVQELIDKIKTEGIQTANVQAEEIKQQAQAQAKKIVEAAKDQARQIMLEAENQTKKVRESTTMILRQASRDTMLALRKEINNLLHIIIAADVKESLTPDKLGDILRLVIEKAVESKDTSIVNLEVNEKDLAILKESFIAKLKNELKGSVKLKSSNDVSGGFVISYDEGKSSFEFTDENLAGYLSSFVNSHVSSLLKEGLNA